MTLGARLRQVRDHLGESQRSMAARFGLGQNTWQRYENTEAMPKGETLAALADLGINLNWLLTGRGSFLDVALDESTAKSHSSIHGSASEASFNTSLVLELLRELESSIGRLSDELLARHVERDRSQTDGHGEKVAVIRETISALSIERLFSAWLTSRFGSSSLDELSERELQDVFSYVRAVSSMVEPSEETSGARRHIS